MNKRSKHLSGQKASLPYGKCQRLLETLSVVFCIMQGVATANAQAPQRTTAAYYDWTVSCVTAAAGHKSCGLVQTLRSQTSPAAQIGLGRSAGNGTMRLSVEVPANAWLPGGLKLNLSDKKSVISASFIVCVAGRCIADADLTNDQIERMRAQTQAGKIEYANAVQANVSIPISFRGFVEAMDALKKEDASLAPHDGDQQSNRAAEANDPNAPGPEVSQRIAAKVAALSVRLPSFYFGEIREDVPSSIRNFFGVWASNKGFEGKGRQAMLLVTNVSSDGTALGYVIIGPPTRFSTSNSPAWFDDIAGRISNGVLSFEARGSPFKAKLSRQGEITLQTVDSKSGKTVSIALNSIWQPSSVAANK